MEQQGPLNLGALKEETEEEIKKSLSMVREATVSDIPFQLETSEFKSPEIQRDIGGELQRGFLDLTRITGDRIESFNHFLNIRLKRQLEKRSIYASSENNYQRAFKLRYLTNMLPIIEKKMMTPNYCRKTKQTYHAEFYCQVEQYDIDPNTGEYRNNPTDVSDLFQFKMPISLGSQACILSKPEYSSPQTKLALGECPYDPMGYYIIGGKEYLLLMQDQLRMSRFNITFTDPKKGFVGSYISPTLDGTTSLGIFEDKRVFNLKIKFVSNTPIKGINILIPFYALAYQRESVSPEKVFDDFISPFISQANRGRVKYSLFSTFKAVVEIGDLHAYMLKYSDENWMRTLEDELFPQIPSTPEGIYRKLYTLGMYISEYVQVKSGIKSLTDRDAYRNKRIINDGIRFESRIAQLLAKIFSVVQRDVLKSKRVTVRDIRGKINDKAKEILNKFEKSFTKHNWGDQKFNKVKKINISDILNTTSTLAKYSHMTRISTDINRKTKRVQVRMVQLSQLGYVDPGESPESEACGLVKNKTIACWISIERDEDVILSRIYSEQHDGNTFLVSINSYSPGATPFLLNGRIVGWCNAPLLYKILINLRRTGQISEDVCIINDVKDNVLYLFCDASRPTRPLLILDDDEIPIIRKKNIDPRKISFNELVKEGCVEYIDAWEQEYIMLCESLSILDNRNKAIQDLKEQIEKAKISLNLATNESDKEKYRNSLADYQSKLIKIQKTRKYTHCELDPTSLFGFVVASIPGANYDQAPRIFFEAGMLKQALGIAASVLKERYDKTIKGLLYPSRPIFTTQIETLTGGHNLPTGQTVILAIMPWKGFNEEDSMVFKKEAIERGLFRLVIYKTITVKLAIKGRQEMKQRSEVLEEKRTPLPSKHKNPAIYRNLDENGIVKVGSYVKVGDCVVGKELITYRNGQKITTEDKSEYVQIGHEGIVDSVDLEETNNIVNIRIRQVRIPTPGDKFAPRHAQKGTIGVIESEINLPRTANGMVPDVIINPHCIPSRMTIGMLNEICASKRGAIEGEYVNATAFSPFNIDEYIRGLKQYGFQESGVETMYDPIFGFPLESQIFIGPCYDQALKHHVYDKFQARSTGRYNLLDRQPSKGRTGGKAQKVGEMERDTLIRHGALHVLQDRLMLSSDAFYAIFCRKCGIQTLSKLDSLKMFECKLCGSVGESSVCRCRLPYSLILFMNYASGMNLKLSLTLTPKKKQQLLQ